METIKQLRVDGISKGLCGDWQKKLTKSSGVKRLSELFIRGIDFCISEDFPTIEFMVENFKGKCEPYGIFINDSVQEINAPDVVLNGCCDARLMYDQYTVSRLYVRHESHASVTVSDNAIITIDAFDNTFIDIETVGYNCRAIINLYGDATITHKGSRIKIHKKNKQTY